MRRAAPLLAVAEVTIELALSTTAGASSKAWISRRSAPAQKWLPAPVTTIARTEASVSIVSSAACRRSTVAEPIALSRSGRPRVSTAKDSLQRAGGRTAVSFPSGQCVATPMSCFEYCDLHHNDVVGHGSQPWFDKGRTLLRQRDACERCEGCRPSLRRLRRGLQPS